MADEDDGAALLCAACALLRRLRPRVLLVRTAPLLVVSAVPAPAAAATAVRLVLAVLALVP